MRIRKAGVVAPNSLPARNLVGERPEDGRRQVRVECDDASELTRQRERQLRQPLTERIRKLAA